MRTLSERLTALLSETPDLTAAGLAKACGIRPPSVSDWLSGKTKSIRSEHLHAAARYLGVDAEWLATGKGSRAPAEALAPDALNLARVYESATPEQRAVFDALARSYEDDGKKE